MVHRGFTWTRDSGEVTARTRADVQNEGGAWPGLKVYYERVWARGGAVHKGHNPKDGIDQGRSMCGGEESKSCLASFCTWFVVQLHYVSSGYILTMFACVETRGGWRARSFGLRVMS
jgi:hypothetical protein